MSKASEWYEAQMRVQRTYKVSEGTWAKVTMVEQDGARLQILLDKVTVMPSADEAVAFARWLLDTFGGAPA